MAIKQSLVSYEPCKTIDSYADEYYIYNWSPKAKYCLLYANIWVQYRLCPLLTSVAAVGFPREFTNYVLY